MYENNTLIIQAINIANNSDEYEVLLARQGIKYQDNDSSKPIISCSFDEIFNQPYTPNDGTFHDLLTFYNVWDRYILNFHASFVPFDTYQFLGSLGDVWNNPIIYQDPNTSPLFNVWTTADMKEPFPILHDSFIIRMTFIISSDSNYH